MEKARIDDLALDIPAVCEHLWQVIGNPGIVRNRALIVPGTKALHHVLPDLVPPMDRAWTGAFFLWSAAAPKNAQVATFTPDVHRAGAGGPRREASRIHRTRLAYQQVQGSGQCDHRLLHAQRDRMYTDLSQPALDSRTADMSPSAVACIDFADAHIWVICMPDRVVGRLNRRSVVQMTECRIARGAKPADELGSGPRTL